MITDYEPDEVGWQGGRPATVGDLALGQPTGRAATARGWWGLYAVGGEVVVVHPGGAVRGRADAVAGRLRRLAGDQAQAGEERQAAGALLQFLGGDDPGAAGDAPRSRAERPPPASYPLSGGRNAPPAAEPPTPAEQAERRSGAGG